MNNYCTEDHFLQNNRHGQNAAAKRRHSGDIQVVPVLEPAGVTHIVDDYRTNAGVLRNLLHGDNGNCGTA